MVGGRGAKPALRHLGCAAPGRGRNIVLNVILGAIAALVAYGRFVVAPF
jgi:hypothetical protein